MKMAEKISALQLQEGSFLHCSVMGNTVGTTAIYFFFFFFFFFFGRIRVSCLPSDLLLGVQWVLQDKVCCCKRVSHPGNCICYASFSLSAKISNVSWSVGTCSP